MDPETNETPVMPAPEILDQMDAHIYQVAIFRAALELQIWVKVAAREEERFSSEDNLGHEQIITPPVVRRGTKQSTHPGRFQSGNLPIDRTVRGRVRRVGPSPFTLRKGNKNIKNRLRS